MVISNILKKLGVEDFLIVKHIIVTTTFEGAITQLNKVTTKKEKYVVRINHSGSYSMFELPVNLKRITYKIIIESYIMNKNIFYDGNVTIGNTNYSNCDSNNVILNTIECMNFIEKQVKEIENANNLLVANIHHTYIRHIKEIYGHNRKIQKDINVQNMATINLIFKRSNMPTQISGFVFFDKHSYMKLVELYCKEESVPEMLKSKNILLEKKILGSQHWCLNKYYLCCYPHCTLIIFKIIEGYFPKKT